MKFLFSFILFLVSVQSSFAQIPPDGPFKDYFDSGELSAEGQYKNGRPDGNWKIYHKNGKVARVYSYHKGKRNKDEILYYENGTIQIKTEKKDNIYITSGFYKSGKLKYERQLKSGYFKSFLENGTVEIEANYKDHELSGVWKRYYENGNIEWLLTYKNDERNGVYKHFYDNGDLKLEGKAENDKKEGEEKRYLPNMILEWKGDYNKDRLHNTWTKFNAKGKKIAKLKYYYGSLSNPDSTAKLEVTTLPDGVFERIAVYPGCESFRSNRAIKKCMNEKVTKIIKDNFNTNLGYKIGMSGKKRIFVIFKVDKKGNVVEVDAKAPHPKLEAEAIRVISLLPKLKPAKQGGELVKMPFSIPILVQL